MDGLKYKIVLPVIVVLALTACGSSIGGGRVDGSTVAGDPPTTGFSVELKDTSFFAGGTVEGIVVNTSPTESGRLIIKVSIDNAENLKGMFFDLHYDETAYHPISANPTGLLAPIDSLLHLAILDDPGVVHFGEAILKPDTVAGFSGSGVVALVEFESGHVPDQERKKDTSALNENQIDLWFWSADTLSWKYTNPGDYDLNGEVNLADIVPIVLHFGKRIQGGDPRHITLVDGDGNLEINLADLSVIAKNYGNSHLGGYDLFSSDSPEDYPQQSAGENGSGAVFEGNIPFTDLLGEDQEYLGVGYNFDFLKPLLNASTEKYYWIRPIPSPGQISQASSIASYQYFVNAYDQDHEEYTNPGIIYDRQLGLITIYYQNAGDTDQDSIVLPKDGYHQVSLIIEYLYYTGPFDIDSILWVIDANPDNEVNLSDLTPTASRMTCGVAGYKVYTVTSPTDIENTKTLVADLPFSMAIGNPNTERLRFEFDATGLDGEFGVIQAYTYKNEVAGQIVLQFGE